MDYLHDLLETLPEDQSELIIDQTDVTNGVRSFLRAWDDILSDAEFISTIEGLFYEPKKTSITFTWRDSKVTSAVMTPITGKAWIAAARLDDGRLIVIHLDAEGEYWKVGRNYLIFDESRWPTALKELTTPRGAIRAFSVLYGI